MPSSHVQAHPYSDYSLKVVDQNPSKDMDDVSETSTIINGDLSDNDSTSPKQEHANNMYHNLQATLEYQTENDKYPKIIDREISLRQKSGYNSALYDQTTKIYSTNVQDAENEDDINYKTTVLRLRIAGEFLT